MSATTPDVPLHPRTDRWVFRSGGESGRVSRAERRGEHRGHEARRACADASEKPDRPWHRTTSSSRIITLRSRRVKAFLSLGEFAHDATAGIFNDYVALQVWAGTPDVCQKRNFRPNCITRGEPEATPGLRLSGVVLIDPKPLVHPVVGSKQLEERL